MPGWGDDGHAPGWPPVSGLREGSGRSTELGLIGADVPAPTRQRPRTGGQKGTCPWCQISAERVRLRATADHPARAGAAKAISPDSAHARRQLDAPVDRGKPARVTAVTARPQAAHGKKARPSWRLWSRRCRSSAPADRSADADRPGRLVARQGAHRRSPPSRPALRAGAARATASGGRCRGPDRRVLWSTEGLRPGIRCRSAVGAPHIIWRKVASAQSL